MARQSEPAVREGAGREGPSELWVAGPSAREPRRACGLEKSGSAACHGSAGRGRSKPLLQSAERLGSFYVRCWARCLFISNMLTRSLPNTAWSFSSALISRLLAGSWKLLAEHGLELLVGPDLALVGWVLELVRLDVVPHLAHHLGPGKRLGTHHRRKLVGRLQRLHQRRVDLLARRARACAGRLGWTAFRCCRAALRLAGHGRSPSDSSDRAVQTEQFHDHAANRR